jgi:hypothetical protein
MAIVNKNILLLGVIPFELEASNGKGWLIDSVSKSFNSSLSYTPNRGTDVSSNPLGNFDASVDANIDMQLKCNKIEDVKRLETLLGSLTLIDTVGAVATSWNDSIVDRTAKKLKNFVLLPTLACNFYSNKSQFNSFFFKLLTGVSIDLLSEDVKDVFIINMSFTSKFIAEAVEDNPISNGALEITGI